MRLTFDKARWSQESDGFWLHLKVAESRLAQKFIASMKDKLYTADLKEKKKHRSPDANAYFWVLAGKLGAKLGISPEEVYRQYIRDVADNYVIQPVREDMLEHWDKLWCDKHLGRITEDMGPCRTIKGYHNVRCFFGSSDYDTAQMSRLIDLIVEDCKRQGIETKTPEELAIMKETWNAQTDEIHGDSEGSQGDRRRAG